jgi:GAF domain-containing protein
MLTREPRVVPAGTPSDLVPRGESTGAVRFASFIVCPLIVRKKAVGAVVAARAGDPPVGDGDLAIVQLFCSQASLALDRAAG